MGVSFLLVCICRVPKKSLYTGSTYNLLCLLIVKSVMISCIKGEIILFFASIKVGLFTGIVAHPSAACTGLHVRMLSQNIARWI